MRTITSLVVLLTLVPTLLFADTCPCPKPKPKAKTSTHTPSKLAMKPLTTSTSRDGTTVINFRTESVKQDNSKIWIVATIVATGVAVYALSRDNKAGDTNVTVINPPYEDD